MAAGIGCPLPVKNCNDQEYTLEEIGNRKQGSGYTESGSHLVRLLTYIDGTILKEIVYKPLLLNEVGKCIGKIHNILKSYNHPAISSYNTLWSLANVTRLKSYLHVIKNKEQCQIISEIIAAFNQDVKKRESNLPAGVIHGDYNANNILVEVIEKNDQNTRYGIRGVIDFGDMHTAPYIYEVAVTIMHLMTESEAIDPIDSGGYVLAGYVTERSISDLEWSVLYNCVAGRYAQTIALGIESSLKDPENEYVTEMVNRSWLQLEKFWTKEPESIYKKWRQIIESDGAKS